MGESNLSLDSNIVGIGQAADKNKQTKRKVGHTKQTKKETINKQTKAKNIEQTTIIMRTGVHYIS